MPATVAQLGARVLRKLGIALVANAARPADGASLTAADVAGRVMRSLGVVVDEADRPNALPPVSVDELAARTLRAVGVNPIAGVVPGNNSVTAPEIARRALRAIGVNPIGITPGVITGSVYTNTQIATFALIKLAIVGSSETPDPADLGLAGQIAQDVHDMLAGMDLAYWQANAIPATVSEAYVNLTVNFLAPAFGKPASPDNVDKAIAMVRQQVLSGSLAQGWAETKVGAVHDALAAENFVAWDAGQIPNTVSEAYVTLTTSMLAPIYGKPVDAAERTAAVTQVRRQALSGVRGQALAVTKVQAVHEALNVQGLVSWPITAVPSGYAEDYVAMAASLMAPMYGAEADKAAWDLAEGRVRKAGLIASMEQRAIDRIQGIQAELNAAGLVSWDDDHIPAALADAMASMAMMQMPEYGRPYDPKAYQAAEDRVWRVSMGGPAGQALAEQKIVAVHEQLEALGKSRWHLSQIPIYIEETYVSMAAYLLAPECRMKPDPMWMAAGEAYINKVIELPTDHHPVVASYF